MGHNCGRRACQYWTRGYCTIDHWLNKHKMAFKPSSEIAFLSGKPTAGRSLHAWARPSQGNNKHTEFQTSFSYWQELRTFIKACHASRHKSDDSVDIIPPHSSRNFFLSSYEFYLSASEPLHRAVISLCSRFVGSTTRRNEALCRMAEWSEGLSSKVKVQMCALTAERYTQSLNNLNLLM